MLIVTKNVYHCELRMLGRNCLFGNLYRQWIIHYLHFVFFFRVCYLFSNGKCMCFDIFHSPVLGKISCLLLNAKLFFALILLFDIFFCEIGPWIECNARYKMKIVNDSRLCFSLPFITTLYLFWKEKQPSTGYTRIKSLNIYFIFIWMTNTSECVHKQNAT